MEVANVRLRLNKVGSDVPMKDVTPAEAMLLHILHGPANGGLTFGEEFAKIEIVGSAKVEDLVKVVKSPARPAVGEVGKPGYQPAVAEVSTKEPGLRDRTNAEEYRRLFAKYNGARDKTNKPLIESIWPDRLNPQMPAKFSDIKWQEVGSTGLETAAVNYATGGLAQSGVK